MPVAKRKTSRTKRASVSRVAHPGYLTTLTIKNFRGIKDVRIDGLAPLTVLTGDNGAGKTTMLEAVFALYGRTTATWTVGLQGSRGLNVIGQQGPSYLGFFHGGADLGTAVISGHTDKGISLRLELSRSEHEASTVIIGSRERSLATESEKLADLGALLGTPVPSLVLKAFRNDKLESKSELVMTFRPPNQLHFEQRGGKAADPQALLQHPAGGNQDLQDKTRYNDLREKGETERVIEVLRRVNPHVRDVEYLETTRSAYFRAQLDNGLQLPLGMLGGGAVNAFRSAVNIASVGSGFLGIDELENGFHFKRHKEVFLALLEARKHFGPQLVLSTHSSEALNAIVQAATEHDPTDFVLVHLRRESDDSVHATVIPGVDAKSSLEHGYDLR